MTMTRRTFLVSGPAMGLVSRGWADGAPSVPEEPSSAFPAQNPDVVRETVSVSHGNVARVRELLAMHPALAKAAWDWGYGDWETALGAASHVGNREIAELLIAAGARPTLFSAAMLGQLDVVRAFVTASPGVQRVKGPHGLTLLFHAKAGGARAEQVAKYLESLGDADRGYTNLPLTDEDKDAVVGTFAYGTGEPQRLMVASTPRGLTIARQGAVERNLFHLGSRTFHPAGADAVRIRFEPDTRPAGSVTIEDGPVIVTAKRV
jgi:hypothetical protein